MNMLLLLIMFPLQILHLQQFHPFLLVLCQNDVTLEEIRKVCRICRVLKKSWNFS